MQATVVAAGSRAAISCAKFGPETTATLSVSTLVISAITSVMRSAVPSSTPLISDTKMESVGIDKLQAERFPRKVWAGIASTTRSASVKALSGFVVARMFLGRVSSGKYAWLMCVELMSSAIAALRAQSETSHPASARIIEKTDPQEPAPITATRIMTLLSFEVQFDDLVEQQVGLRHVAHSIF